MNKRIRSHILIHIQFISAHAYKCLHIKVHVHIYACTHVTIHIRTLHVIDGGCDRLDCSFNAQTAFVNLQFGLFVLKFPEGKLLCLSCQEHVIHTSD